jgi:UPF0716 protein FxsA
MWLFVAFLVVPLIEIALFIQIGGAIGLGWTLLTVVVTAALGTYLVRQQGLLAMSQVRASFSEVRDPTEPLVHGAMILFSGALLLTPGFFTDAIGFLLLVPSIRSAAYEALRKRVHVAQMHQRPHRPDPRDRPHRTGPHANDVIEGEYDDITDEARRHHGPSGWTKH